MSINCKEIVLIAEPTFQSSSPSCFIGKDPTNGIQAPTSLAATVIADKSQFSNYNKCVTVETFEDLEEVRRQVCDRPLVLMVTCGKHVPMGQR